MALTNSTILKENMIIALEKSLGIVTTACKNVGISRFTHYNWYKTDPEYKKAVDSIQDITLDFAESQLHRQIKDGNTSATIFYLKTKGKGRGYVERTEITGADGGSIELKPLFPDVQTIESSKEDLRITE